MKATLKQLFANYPLSMTGLAGRIGKSREWISGLTHGRLNLKNENRKAAIELITNELHQLADELKQIEIDEENE